MQDSSAVSISSPNSDGLWQVLLGLRDAADFPLPEWLIWRDGQLALRNAAAAESDVTAMLQLYGPLVAPSARNGFVLAHLGQSLDGRIATENGVSQYISGPENLTHLHRLRALSDAVVVGASTVAHDDPRLTTRLVPGPNPARVVIDPHRRLRVEHGIFCDGASPTYLVSTPESLAETPAPEGATILSIPGYTDGVLPIGAILDILKSAGLNRLFVEGGGKTVSAFLEAGRLDRLHVAVSPMIIGSGRAGLTLPVIDTLDKAIRPAGVGIHRMGDDVLFDCSL